MKASILTASVASAAFLAAASAAQAYTLTSVEEVLSTAEIQTALTNAGITTSNTDSIDGIAIMPNASVFLVHNDAGALSFARIFLSTNTVDFSMTEADVLSDLALSGNLTLTGEVTWDSTNSRLILATDINATTGSDPWTVFQINASPTPSAATILSDTSIIGWNSQGVTSNGTIVGALAENILAAGEPQVVTIDESGTPVAVTLFDEGDFQAATSSTTGDVVTGELPAEAIGIHPANDTIYVFCHDNFEIFSIAGTSALAPVDVEINGWDDAATLEADRTDLHGIAVDENGNVFGFDEGGEAIVVWDGNDTATDRTAAFTLADLTTQLGGGDFEPTVWSGMKVQAISPTETEVILASSNANYGVVRLVVNTSETTNVGDWSLYQ